MTELYVSKRSSRLPPPYRERGGVNIMFAAFILLSLGFLFSQLVPLMNRTASEDSQNEVFALLASGDMPVTMIGPNGSVEPLPAAAANLQSVVASVDKQVGAGLGAHCIALLRFENSAVTERSPYQDYAGNTNPCGFAAATGARQAAVTQGQAMGHAMKRNPYIVSIFNRFKPEKFFTQPVVSLSKAQSTSVTPAPPSLVVPPGGPTVAPTVMPTQVPTPPGAGPTSTPIPGQFGGGNGNNEGNNRGGDQELGEAGIGEGNINPDLF